MAALRHEYTGSEMLYCPPGVRASSLCETTMLVHYFIYNFRQIGSILWTSILKLENRIHCQ